MASDIRPDRALIFRIVHRDNVPWILDHGLHCNSSGVLDPNYIGIGNTDLIASRRQRVVPCPPHGTLSDYIPFYFTPRSPMMLNIKTGYGAVPKRANDEIVIVVSSLHRLYAQGLPFVFTDRHAYLQVAEFFSDLGDLNRIDWPILQAGDFKRNPDDPGKFERYQAEALVYRQLPVSALRGMACYGQATATSLSQLASSRGISLRTIAQPKWYF